MTFEEKLSILDQEIRTLHQFCINKGYNPLQVEKEARPLLSSIARSRLKRQGSFLAKGAVIVAVLALVCYVDPVYRLLLLAGRLASIQVCCRLLLFSNVLGLL